MLHTASDASRALRLSLATLCLLAAVSVQADEIVVDGKPMSGKVVKVTPKGLDVKTDYGKGNVLVPYDKVTSLRTDEPFTLIVSDEDEIVGNLVGVKDGNLLVGADAASARAVPVDSLHDSVTQKEFEESQFLRLRSTLRYWNARYDLAFSGTDATRDTLSLTTGFEVERRKRPTRFLTTGSYRFGTLHDKDNDPRHQKTENELLGMVRGEYDVTPRIYGFAATSAEYDQIESLSLRLTPKAGPGYRIFNIETESEKRLWSVDVGGAWVYERFFGGSTNSYASIAFGTEGAFSLPWGSLFTFRGSYLPAIDDWANNYLLRGEANLLFPMTSWLSFRTGVLDTYTSQPADDADHNSVTGTAGLALVF
jgi:hypothetical protein